MKKRSVVLSISALVILTGVFILLYFFNSNTSTKRERTKQVIGSSVATEVTSYTINNNTFTNNSGVWTYTDEESKKSVPINQNTFSQITESFLNLESGRVIDPEPSEKSLQEYGLANDKTEIRAFNTDAEPLFVFVYSAAAESPGTIYYQLSEKTPVFKTRNSYFSDSFKANPDHWYDLRLIPFELSEENVLQVTVTSTDENQANDSDENASLNEPQWKGKVTLLRSGDDWTGEGFPDSIDWTKSRLSSDKVNSYIKRALALRASSIDLGTFTSSMYKEKIDFSLVGGESIRYQLIEFADTRYVKVSGESIVHDVAYIITDSNKDSLFPSINTYIEDIPEEVEDDQDKNSEQGHDDDEHSHDDDEQGHDDDEHSHDDEHGHDDEHSHDDDVMIE